MPIPTIEEFTLLHANICEALADTKRLQILFALSEGPCNVSALARLLSAPQPTISRHLTVLRQRALVETERDGTSIIYRLADPRIIDALNIMRLTSRDAMQRRAGMVSPPIEEPETDMQG
jgi:ArsR family transcriptional regulator